MFIIGFPTDTKNTINKTIQYAKKLNTTYAQFSVWTPYPGTPIFEKFKDKLLTIIFKILINIHLYINMICSLKMK